MNRRRVLQSMAAFAAAAMTPRVGAAATPPRPVATQHDGGVRFRWSNNVASHEMGELVLDDEKVRRPYFKDLCLSFSDQRLTRPYPPGKDDPQDHSTMHPGVWLSFGDLNGQDFWRHKSRVVLDKKIGSNELGFSGKLQLRYESNDGRHVARESFQYKFRWRDYTGWRLEWDSTFEPIDEALTFGDQEEMGLGVRMATELTVTKGGTIVDNEGRKNEKEIWGKTADWCRYGTKTVGVQLMAHPENFKRSTFHVRDYGLMVANPFAEQAFGRAKEPAKTVVKPGKSLRLRFAITGFRGADFDAAAEYDAYVKAQDK